MQAEVLKFLRERASATTVDDRIIQRRIEGEMPFSRRGQVVAFADAIEIVETKTSVIVSLFEIKPRIDTVFGILRQVKALLKIAQSAIAADVHVCNLIVPASDPKLMEMRREWPNTWAWGIEFGKDAEAF